MKPPSQMPNNNDRDWDLFVTGFVAGLGIGLIGFVLFMWIVGILV